MQSSDNDFEVYREWLNYLIYVCTLIVSCGNPGIECALTAQMLQLTGLF